MPNKRNAGDGLWAWLGRQAGYLKTAIKHDPVNGAKPQAAKPSPPTPQKPAAPPPAKVVYRADQVQELPHPTNPQLKLRRTVIDEVIVDKKIEHKES